MKKISEITRDKIERNYIENHRKSEKYFKWGQQVFPGGMPRNMQFHRPFPIVVERGEGSNLIDLDGNQYIDFCNNFSSLILGHAHPLVLEAVQNAISRGTVHSNPTPVQYELAENLCNRIPSIDQIRFVNSGTEAGMWVIRLARAFTGKNKIIKMEGGYHGLSDSLDISVHPPLKKAGNHSNPCSVPDDQGIPPATVQDTLVVPFNGSEATQSIFDKNVEDLAAVIVEPMLGSAGMIPPEDGYLRLLRDLTSRHNVLLIFDEVITLRLAYGGAQQRFNIYPDLSMLGKIIGGGFPVGAFGGRQDIMALISPLNNAVSHSGTFSANNASMAAGIVTMKELTHEVYDDLEAMGKYLRKITNDIFKDLGIKGQATGLGSCFAIHFNGSKIKNYRDVVMGKADNLSTQLLNLALLNRGIYITRTGRGYISAVNTENEIDSYANALYDSLKEIYPVIEEQAPELIYR